MRKMSQTSNLGNMRTSSTSKLKEIRGFCQVGLIRQMGKSNKNFRNRLRRNELKKSSETALDYESLLPFYHAPSYQCYGLNLI